MSLSPALAVDLVTNEAIRLQALSTIFPNMSIRVEPNRRIDSSWPLKRTPQTLYLLDALKDEKVYRVQGPAVSDAERCASENMQTEKMTDVREVRFQLYNLSGVGASKFVAVIQYVLSDASPAGACWSIGKFFLFSFQNKRLRVLDQYEVETTHHTSIQSIGFLDLKGDGVEELVVESNWGGRRCGFESSCV